MKRISFFLILIVCASINGWAQKKAPEEKSVVKKEYDENGNLIQYDSTYVWQWSSDSTFNFSFGDNLFSGREFPDFFGDLYNDSIFKHFGFLNEHPFPSPNDEELFQHFHHSFPELKGFPDFPFGNDSIFNFRFGQPFPDNFGFGYFGDLQKQLQEQFNRHSFRFPDFKTPEQQEEWEKLMQKQQKEKEELLKKWGTPQSKKTY